MGHISALAYYLLLHTDLATCDVCSNNSSIYAILVNVMQPCWKISRGDDVTFKSFPQLN